MPPWTFRLLGFLPLALLLPPLSTASHPPLFNRISAPGAQQRVLNLTTDRPTESEEEEQMTTTANKMPVESASVKAKVRRLKQLRAEMRTLATMIREEKRRRRNRKGNTVAKAHASPTVTAEAMRSELSRQFRKWRKRMQTKMHFLEGRMSNLEGELRRTRDHLQKVMRGDKGGDGAGGRGSGGGTTTATKWSKQPALLSADTIRRVQLRRRGEGGSRCQEHGECKPGHCCQRVAPVSALPLPIGQGPGHCVRFARVDGAPCEHSCACEAQLLCFREHSAQMAKNGTEMGAVCKRASSTDLLNGMYENALQTMFEHNVAAAGK